MRYDLADAAVVVTGANGAARRLLEVLRFDAVIGTVESPAIAVGSVPPTGHHAARVGRGRHRL
jgi:hypothetical protein